MCLDKGIQVRLQVKNLRVHSAHSDKARNVYTRMVKYANCNSGNKLFSMPFGIVFRNIIIIKYSKCYSCTVIFYLNLYSRISVDSWEYYLPSGRCSFLAVFRSSFHSSLSVCQSVLNLTIGQSDLPGS